MTGSRDIRDPLADAPRWKRRVVLILSTPPMIAVIIAMGFRAGWRLIRREIALELWDLRRLWR
jgi:hypothetical protein